MNEIYTSEYADFNANVFRPEPDMPTLAQVAAAFLASDGEALSGMCMCVTGALYDYRDGETANDLYMDVNDAGADWNYSSTARIIVLMRMYMTLNAGIEFLARRTSV